MNGMVPGGGMDMGAAGAGGAGAGAGTAAGGKAAKVAQAKAASSNKFKRVAGGKSWEDETLAEWPESKWSVFRCVVGYLYTTGLLLFLLLFVS